MKRGFSSNYYFNTCLRFEAEPTVAIREQNISHDWIHKLGNLEFAFCAAHGPLD